MNFATLNICTERYVCYDSFYAMLTLDICLNYICKVQGFNAEFQVDSFHVFPRLNDLRTPTDTMIPWYDLCLYTICVTSGGPVGGCQVSTHSQAFNLGYIHSKPVVSGNGTLTLVYTNGDVCHLGKPTQAHRSTRINFFCSPQEVSVASLWSSLMETCVTAGNRHRRIGAPGLTSSVPSRR